MPRASLELRIGAPPERVMAVLVDFGSYPDFLPEIESVRVLFGSEDAWEVAFVLRLVRPVRYTLRLERRGPLVLAWSLVEGDLLANEGSWELRPIEPGGTLARYTIDVQPGVYLPGSLVRTLAGHQLAGTLDRFRRRIEGRTG